MAQPPAEAERRIDAAVARYEQLAEEDSQIGIDELLRSFPDCETRLREHIGNHQRVDAICAPLRRAVTAACAAPEIEGYDHLVEIGRGGMGVVYRATQTSTQRTVAVKVIRPERLASLDPRARDELIARFRIEPIATMDHQNIVRIYHAGSVGDKPYLIMELVRGVTLREHIRSGRCSVAEVVGLVEQAARGIHHAHRHGVLHRDIKPANLIIELDSRVVKVADFGLAKLDQQGASGRESGDYRTSDVMGTLPYMSPEQLDDSDDVTIASDVYGLAATLYESLAGRPPFCGSTDEVRRAIRTEMPAPLRQVSREIPRAVEKICERGLAKNPADRFESAEQLANELRRLRVVAGGNAAVHFANMGWPLLLFGIVCMVIHTGVFVLVRFRVGEPWIWLLMFSAYLPLFAMFGMTNTPSGDSRTTAGRQLWTLWLGHLVTVAFAIVSIRYLTSDATLTLHAAYPILSACTATTLLIMASTFWRYHALLAVAWIAVAASNLLTPAWAPLEFAVAALITSFVIGVYELRLMNRRLPIEPMTRRESPLTGAIEHPSLLVRPALSDPSSNLGMT